MALARRHYILFCMYIFQPMSFTGAFVYSGARRHDRLHGGELQASVRLRAGPRASAPVLVPQDRAPFFEREWTSAVSATIIHARYAPAGAAVTASWMPRGEWPGPPDYILNVVPERREPRGRPIILDPGADTAPASASL